MQVHDGVTGQCGRVLVGRAAAQTRDTLHRHAAGIGCRRSGRHDHRQCAIQLVAPLPPQLAGRARPRSSGPGPSRRSPRSPTQAGPGENGAHQRESARSADRPAGPRPAAAAPGGRRRTGPAARPGSGSCPGPTHFWPRSLAARAARRWWRHKRDDRGDQESGPAGANRLYALNVPDMPGMTTPSASTYGFAAHCTAGGHIRVRVAPARRQREDSAGIVARATWASPSPSCRVILARKQRQAAHRSTSTASLQPVAPRKASTPERRLGARLSRTRLPAGRPQRQPTRQAVGPYIYASLVPEANAAIAALRAPQVRWLCPGDRLSCWTRIGRVPGWPVSPWLGSTAYGASFTGAAARSCVPG